MPVFDINMSAKYMFSLLFLLFLSCKNEKTVLLKNNEIDLSEIILHLSDELHLSELVDSVSYIPLETNNENMLSGYPIVNLTNEYIFYYNYCFDWNGCYLHQVGTLGQGACEEPGFLITNLAFVNEHFYSCGMKFIEYDKNGICTGKERSLYHIENQNIEGRFANIGQIKRVGTNLVGFNFPDMVYFFNTDFEVINQYPIMEWEHLYCAQMITSEYYRSLTQYEDTVVFYNYYTDTIYHITDKSLTPKWIIQLEQKDKMSVDYTYKNQELMNEAFEYWKKGKIEQSRLCKLVDKKIITQSVYESDNYLFIYASLTKFAPELRGLPSSDPPFMICVEKSTMKPFGGKKIIDDIGGLDTFFPSWGIINNKMVSAIWPYQLHEFIKERQNENKKIDDRLLELKEKIDLEDNPILIIAHLKK